MLEGIIPFVHEKCVTDTKNFNIYEVLNYLGVKCMNEWYSWYDHSKKSHSSKQKWGLELNKIIPV